MLEMKSKKTLLRKYLWVNMTTVLITFLILSSMIFSFVTSYWKNEKEEVFTENAHYISNIVANNSCVENNNIAWINGDAVKIFMDTLSSNMKIDILVTDTKGNIIINSVYNKDSFLDGTVPDDIIQKVFDENYSDINNLGGIYKSNQYIIGEPVYSTYGGVKTVIGMVFTVMDPSSLLTFTGDMLKIFLFAFVIALLISFWTARRLSYSMVNPLRQMSDVAISISEGDFSKRVAVKGEDEIAELGKSFNNMAESLYTSESVRKNFVANVSHELKTPMTTITGFIDGILDGVIAQEDTTKYLKIVSSETKRLSRLVKKMLNLSKIDNDKIKLNITKVNLYEILLNVLLSFENKIEGKHIEIRGVQQGKSAIIYADEDMIHQVIYNLIENAVKFTNISGYINIDLLDSEEEFTLFIENSGNSIPNEELRFIFDRFYKVDKSRSQDKNGMGLGLYIVKKIILFHKGSIRVSTSKGKSTTFILNLPKTKNKTL